MSGVAKRGLAIFVGVLVIAAAAGLGYGLGRHDTRAVVWHTGQAYIGDHEASITTPGWTYGFVSSVPRWIDAVGSLHSDSWPDCVGPSGTTKSVRFATVTVSATDTTWRPVVFVDCRQR